MGSAPRACVTGATGFIGSHMVARLKAEGYWVRAVDVNHSALRFDLYAQADDVQIADVRDYSVIAGLLSGMDRVYHFASDMGGVGYFFSDADYKASVNNARMDLNVLRACERSAVERLFYASSFCAYPIADQRLAGPGRAVRAMREEDLGGGPAEQLYGEEKRFVTLLAAKAPVDVRCGVFSTIYGPGQDMSGERAKFPTAIIRKVLEARGGEVEVWGDGTQVRTFLYIDDAIERMRRIMDQPYHGPVNVGSDEQVTVRECADWVCELAGAKPNYRWMPDKPTGVMAKQSDNRAFHDRYGAAPQTPMRDGFRKVFEWMAPLVEEKVAA